MAKQAQVEKQAAQPKKEQEIPKTGRNNRSPRFATDRNKREVIPNLSETHRILTAVQFGDRASLLIRKRMSMSEGGQLPASKALGLLEQYEQATKVYLAAVDAMCKAVNIGQKPKKSR